MKMQTLIVIIQYKKIWFIVSYAIRHTNLIRENNICNFTDKRQGTLISEQLINNNLKDFKNTIQ